MELEDCLPPALRGAAIVRIGQGMSGAGVYKVGDAHVLKVSSDPVEDFRVKQAIRERAAAAGVGPAVVHVDEARRAVVSELIADRGFAPWFMNPQTRPQAIAELGRTLAKVHALEAPEGAKSIDARATIAGLAAESPAYVRATIDRVLALPVPPSDRATGLSHNDVNPSNLAWDGTRLVLLDWDTAGPNEPLVDLAAIAMFLRMDDDTVAQLIAAHDSAPVAAIPERFRFDRTLVAVLCGAIMVKLVRARGFAGDDGANGPTLAEFYARMRGGEVSLQAPEGQWLFGLALVREAAAP